MSFYYLQQNERGTFDIVVMPAITPAPVLQVGDRYTKVCVRRYTYWCKEATQRVPGVVKPGLRDWD